MAATWGVAKIALKLRLLSSYESAQYANNLKYEETPVKFKDENIAKLIAQTLIYRIQIFWPFASQ